MLRARNSASIKLQNAWKKYRMLSMVPKAIKQSRNRKLTLIQKYLRGHFAFNKVSRELGNNLFAFQSLIIWIVKMKLSQLDMFDKLKQKLYEDSQIKIRYCWNLYKRRVKMQKSKKRKVQKVVQNSKVSAKPVKGEFLIHKIFS